MAVAAGTMISLGTIKNQSEIAEALDVKFELLRRMIRNTVKGKMHGAVTHGRGGIGKTWTVEEVLEELRKDIRVTKITGHVSPLELYNTLMENSTAKSVILLDDCDNAITDIKALNLLKAATDTKAERWIHWATTSAKVPTTEFRFFGKVIVITNHDLTATSHYRAFMDRVPSLNMTLTPEETLVRIAQIASKRAPAGKSKKRKATESVIRWIEKNFGRFDGNLSLRVFEKAMDMAEVDPEWETLAEVTILRELIH